MKVSNCPFRAGNEVTVQRKPKSKSKDKIEGSDSLNTLEDKFNNVCSIKWSSGRAEKGQQHGIHRINQSPCKGFSFIDLAR